jgi:murein DD-endopeptidase MepM/ murein hydrolase activator NlpD
MRYQIILLPRKDYWSWVSASRDYVLKFGPNLTSDPTTAGNYMAPRQAISFPLVPGGYPEQGDIERWFQTHYPGIRLDPIEAGTPGELQEAFARRVIENDRYGQKQRPFYLLWPTDFPIVTQEYGANPQIYIRWGFPGHEGIDFRALTSTNIYCCADGEVYRVHKNPKDHPYGIHIRIRHRDGYKTVYAHLVKALVAEGQTVEAGQVIGKADSTGASTGAHLHLTLKRDGATERQETEYPKDVIDPTPYLVWPDAYTSKSMPGQEWTPGKCLIGAHGRVAEFLEEDDLALISEARLEAVKLEMCETKKNIERLRVINPAMFLAVRLTVDFSSDPVPADNFLARVEKDVGRLYRLGLRYFEVHVNPNLQFEGWQRSWRDGTEFSRWFIEVVSQLKHSYPKARFGFPGLSPGGMLSGWRADAEQFLHEAEEAVAFADWVGVNCYWNDSEGMKMPDGGRVYEEYRFRFPDKLLFITEFYNPSASIDPLNKGQQYLEYYRMLRELPGIGAVFAFVLSAPAGHDAITWRAEGRQGSRIAGIIGNRKF